MPTEFAPNFDRQQMSVDLSSTGDSLSDSELTRQASMILEGNIYGVIHDEAGPSFDAKRIQKVLDLLIDDLSDNEDRFVNRAGTFLTESEAEARRDTLKELASRTVQSLVMTFDLPWELIEENRQQPPLEPPTTRRPPITASSGGIPVLPHSTETAPYRSQNRG